MNADKEYLDSIKSQQIPLCVLDTQGSFSNIPFVFFYENTDSSADFMSSGILRDSFFRTMQQFPIFAGRIKGEGRGRISIVIDKDNVNMPDYVESTGDVHIDELKEAKFSWRAWPAVVATAGPMTSANKDGEIKLINVHVVRLKENSGVLIYISVPHYVLDGEGHMEVIRRWCSIYQLIASRQAELVDELPAYTFDRSIVLQELPKERAPLDDTTHYTFTKFRLLAELFAWISPKLRGYILSKIVEKQKAESHLFHISQSSFESLRALVSQHLPDNKDVTINHLLLALVTKTLAQAQAAASNKNSGNRSTEDVLPVAVIFETRKQLLLESNSYIGNALMPKIALKPLVELESPTTAESLATTVYGYKELVNNIDAPLVASFIDAVWQIPSCFTRPIVRFARSKTAASFVYDIMPNMYEADFGYGRPVWVSPIEPFRANATLLLTGRNPNDGVDVFLTAYPEVMKEILANKFWASVAAKTY
ncbi:hypothetical protein GGI25_003503 [Coemansia spiralis]|uniref:Uncharacterized protein n=2 Tax=Coemansia TaxID=4863 RepID=A0A9W8G8J9_9FUNG|nr:transferase [Coemansia spiralis]KAJ1991521.1 hypothetical protein EDC05_003445 [Coemansia umbellata]KAJ2621525.1 hypothetical protein GGI26_003988 [Coemansia sp. RSA 1358]KAJ2676751.1 hypothetical protein GGI25_003503 [Coemansia spiralis]